MKATVKNETADSRAVSPSAAWKYTGLEDEVQRQNTASKKLVKGRAESSVENVTRRAREAKGEGGGERGT